MMMVQCMICSEHKGYRSTGNGATDSQGANEDGYMHKYDEEMEL